MNNFLELKQIKKILPWHNSKNYNYLHYNLLLFVISLLTMFLFCICIYGFINTSSFTHWLISTAIIICIVTVIFLVFKQQIYIPITELETTLKKIIEENDTAGKQGIGSVKTLSSSFKEIIKQLNDLINREYTAKILKKEAEINALQSQINPHFLYNTLESIRGQALYEGIESIALLTKSLSGLLKYSINQESSFVSFREELDNIDNYLFIQQYRFNNKFKVIKDIDSDVMNCKVPRLCIQPIVENAIYHGLETKIGMGTLRVHAHITQNRLVIQVEDDGLGIDESKLSKLNEILTNGVDSIMASDSKKEYGIGLVNVNERIRLYFGDCYGIRIYSTVYLGTIVELVLPLKNKI